MADVHGNTTNHSQDGLIICFLNGGMYFQLYHCKRVVCKIWSCAFFNYPFIFAFIYWPLLLPSPRSFLLPCRNYNIMPSYFLVYLSSCLQLLSSDFLCCCFLSVFPFWFLLPFWSLLVQLSFSHPQQSWPLRGWRGALLPAACHFQVLCCLVSLSHQAGWDSWLGLGKEREPQFHNSIDNVSVDMATVSKGP